MGEYLGEHFVAAYQQAGDFEVVNVNGQVQKNGGNVASYFCTADMRVIHAAGGPISSDELLKRARWAVDTYRRAWQFAAGRPKEQKEIVAQAHLDGLRSNLKSFKARVRREFPKAKRDFARWAAERRGSARTRTWQNSTGQHDRDAPDAMTLARRRVADRLWGDEADRLLAADPLAPYGQIRRRMFEKLTGERFNTNRRAVYAAAEQFKRAGEQGNPVMLVLYEGHGHDDQADSSTWLSHDTLLRHEAIAKPLSAFLVAALPLRQFSALTQLVDLPNYEVSQRASRLLILADHQGRQVVTISGSVDPHALAEAMWPLINESRLARAELLAGEGKLAEATPFLERILNSPADDELRARARRRLLELSDQQAQRLSGEGKTRQAMRLLGRTRHRIDDVELREAVGQRLAALRDELD